AKHAKSVYWLTALTFFALSLCAAADAYQMNTVVTGVYLDPAMVATAVTAANILYMLIKLARTYFTLKANTAARIKRASSYLAKTKEPKFAFYFTQGDLNTPM